jgi:hypothetical protein
MTEEHTLLLAESIKQRMDEMNARLNHIQGQVHQMHHDNEHMRLSNGQMVINTQKSNAILDTKIDTMMRISEQNHVAQANMMQVQQDNTTRSLVEVQHNCRQFMGQQLKAMQMMWQQRENMNNHACHEVVPATVMQSS